MNKYMYINVYMHYILVCVCVLCVELKACPNIYINNCFKFSQFDCGVI